MPFDLTIYYSHFTVFHLTYKLQIKDRIPLNTDRLQEPWPLVLFVPASGTPGLFAGRIWTYSGLQKSELWIRWFFRSSAYPSLKAVLLNRIHWIVSWIQHFKWIRFRLRIQGYDDKNWKKVQLKFFSFFLWSRIAIYLSLGPYKRKSKLQEKPSALKREYPTYGIVGCKI